MVCYGSWVAVVAPVTGRFCDFESRVLRERGANLEDKHFSRDPVPHHLGRGPIYRHATPQIHTDGNSRATDWNIPRGHRHDRGFIYSLVWARRYACGLATAAAVPVTKGV